MPAHGSGIKPQRHVEHTLFFIFEEDFMLFASEEQGRPARNLADSEGFLSPATDPREMTMASDGSGGMAPTETVVELGAEWESRLQF